jgi:hypothetical protein
MCRSLNQQRRVEAELTRNFLASTNCRIGKAKRQSGNIARSNAHNTSPPCAISCCIWMAFRIARNAVAGPFTLEKEPALVGRKNITRTETTTTRTVMLKDRNVTFIV